MSSASGTYGRRCVAIFPIGARHVRKANNRKFRGTIAYCHRVFPLRMDASAMCTWTLLVHSPLIMVLSIASRSSTVFRLGLRLYHFKISKHQPFAEHSSITGYHGTYGSPETLTTDQGSQFESQLFSALLKLNGGIDH